MPRKARSQSSTDLYHVMVRGINKEFVFKTKEQKQKLMEFMGEQLDLIKIGSWCIMDNHFHLLVKASLDDMSMAIKIISQRYAAYYNYTKNRIGPTFGDRYKSENVEDERYLLGVLRYIHNNPLKARVVDKTQDYKWSSYNSYLNREDALISEELKEFINGLFGNNNDNFIEFHNQEDDRFYLETKEDLEALRLEVGQRIISDFFKSNGIADISELKIKSDLIEDLVNRLTDESSLSLRQISSLTGLSTTYIYRIGK